MYVGDWEQGKHTHFHHSYSVLYWWAYRCNRQEKGIKGIKIEKEEVKVFADDMITYVKKNLGNLQSNC